MRSKPMVEKKALNLLRLRNYKLIKREEQEDTITFLAQLPREKKKVIIWCLLDKKVVGVAYVNKLRKIVEEVGAQTGIIVADCRYTYAAVRKAGVYNIELIPKGFPHFNIFEHELVPIHEILSGEEVKELLDKYRVKPYQLPRIKASDIVAIAIGARPGDTLRIKRRSVTAGEFVSYRYVTPS